jgi:Tfp pilus assembly protein FimT
MEGDLCVWMDGKPNKSDYDIKAARLATAGGVVTATLIDVCADTTGDNQWQGCPRVSNNFVVWEDATGDFNTDHDIYGAVIDPVTNLASTEFVVNSDTGHKTYPAVSTNAAGTQALVVWEQRTAGTVGDTNWDSCNVFGCFVDLTTSPPAPGTAFAICDESYGQYAADVSGSRVVWADNRGGRPDDDLWSAVVTPGSPPSVVPSGIETTTYDCDAPRIHGDLVAWIDDRNPTTCSPTASPQVRPSRLPRPLPPRATRTSATSTSPTSTGA